MTKLKYIIKRILIAIPVFLAITFAVYVLVNLAPGGPLDILASSGQLSQTDLQALKVSMGLDKPIVVRYFMWLFDMFRGDMGTSYRTGKAVSFMIGERMLASLRLTGTGIFFSILIGIPLGVMSAYKRGSGWDKAGSLIAFIGGSVPSFFFSLVIIYIFAVKLKWFPTSGMVSTSGGGGFADVARHLALPALAIGIQTVGNYIKQTRTSVQEVLNEEYIKTARSKGLKESKIIIKHAFRNALIPVVTTLSLSIPFLIGGAVVVEQIFAWPGIGSLMITSITNRDYPVIMGVTVMISAVVLVANLVLDLVYAQLDPRIAYE